MHTRMGAYVGKLCQFLERDSTAKRLLHAQSILCTLGSANECKIVIRVLRNAIFGYNPLSKPGLGC